MIKAESNNGKTTCECNGTIPTLCADITGIITAILKGIKDEEPKMLFRRTFLKGFDDGIVLGVSKQEMEDMRMKNARAAELHTDRTELLDALRNLATALQKLEDEEDEDEAE